MATSTSGQGVRGAGDGGAARAPGTRPARRGAAGRAALQAVRPAGHAGGATEDAAATTAAAAPTKIARHDATMAKTLRYREGPDAPCTLARLRGTTATRWGRPR